jgi:peptidoglycan/LPS O-acetylase OafA/YrhL
MVIRTDTLPRFQLLQRSQLGEDSYHSLIMSLLRGLAALQVAAAHLRNEFMPGLRTMHDPALWYQGLAFVTGFAHQAVVLFFLISGWLVGGSLLNKMGRPQALRLYAIDRISRLWTVLIPTFALIVALGIADGTLSAHDADFSPDNPYSWSTLAGNLAGLQTVAVPQFGLNYPLWSLANESWYYLMFPLVLLYMAGRRRVLCAAALMLAAALQPFSLTLYFGIWLLGAAFSRVRLECGAPTRAALLLVLVALSLYLRARGGNDDLGIASFGQDLLLSLIFLPLLSSTVIPVAPGLPLLAPLRAVAGVLSGFSFTLYVVHVPVIGMLQWLGLHLYGQDTLQAEALSDLGIYLAMLGFILVFAYGFYRLFEAHTGAVRRALKKLLPAHIQPGLRAM